MLGPNSRKGDLQMREWHKPTIEETEFCRQSWIALNPLSLISVASGDPAMSLIAVSL